MKFILASFLFTLTFSSLANSNSLKLEVFIDDQKLKTIKIEATDSKPMLYLAEEKLLVEVNSIEDISSFTEVKLTVKEFVNDEYKIIATPVISSLKNHSGSIEIVLEKKYKVSVLVSQ